MGREALVHIQVGDEAGEAKALLEAQELILRGEIRRRYAKSQMEDVRVEGPLLLFRCAGETVSLRLGEKVAAAWRVAIATPPPALRVKLGLDKGQKALVLGACDDADLADALGEARTDARAEAAMVIARIDGPEDLQAAQAVCGGLPLWTVYPKGKAASFGDTAIRKALRDAGWRDTKSCAVSERLTATRYHPATPAASTKRDPA
ncbi:hypothetical protein WDZ92_33395 [Nostoc sp. NIES-2111]